MKLLVATRNEGKAREIRDLFVGLPFELVFPLDQKFLEPLPEEADVEHGATFIENASAKARYFARRSGLVTVAEDSGLEVDALNGAPGVHSARFAALYGEKGRGEETGDEANNALLLKRLEGVAEEHRTARYRCVVAYLENPVGTPQIVEAVCEGRILTQPRGTDGFGYDPYFWSLDLEMGFGEAPLAAKQRVSHRGRAMRALIEVLVRRYA